MSYRLKRLLIVLSVLIFLAVVTVVLILFPKFKDNTRVISFNPKVHDINRADKSIVETIGEKSISEEKFKELKDSRKKEKVDVGDLSIKPDDYYGSGFAGTDENGNNIYKPGIDWSEGELSEELLDTMIIVASRLYEDKLNAKEKEKDKYIVESELPEVDDIQKFKIPIFYFVNNGTLTLNLKVSIYDMSKKTEKEVLMPISVKYELDKAVLVDI